MPSRLERLSAIGFVPAGTWRCDGDRLLLDPTEHDSTKKTLYALVVDSEVMYIGKATRTFRQRMRGYCQPGSSQLTNIKNRANMLDAMGKGRAVCVYIMRDAGLLRYGEFYISLAGGLEDSLIQELRPAWDGATCRRD